MVIGIDASRANAAQKTGTEWYSWYLIRVLIPKLSAHKIRLYSREPLHPGLRSLGSNVEERVLSWPPGILWTHLRLSWELLWHRPEVLLITADTVPLIHPLRTFTTIHDIAFEHAPEVYRSESVQHRWSWLRPVVQVIVRVMTLGRFGASEIDYHRWSVRHALRSCPTVMTVSEYTKRELQQYLSVRPDQVQVTYQGIDDTDLSTTSPARPADLPPSYFLYVGRLERKKNMAGLLRGYAAYRQLTNDPISLVLVGNPGFGWSEDCHIIQDMGLQAYIQIRSWQQPGQLTALMHYARAFVFLAPFEGFGRPPLESLRAGVPVVAAQSGSLPEILGQAALFVDQNNPLRIAQGLQQINTDENLRRHILRSGRERVQYFTWDKTADLTAAIIEASTPLPQRP